MPRRAKKVDGDEFTADRQLEDTLQQSAAADVLLEDDEHGSRYYGRKHRPVVTGPSKRKTYPLAEDDTPSTSAYHHREASRERYSVDVANAYPPSSQKRARSSNDWSARGGEPDSNGPTARELPEPPTLRSRRGQGVAEFKERQERQSRFLEGSMNDKVSTQPPSAFIGEDQEYLLSTYMNEHNGVNSARANGWRSTVQTPVTPTLHGKKTSLSSVKTVDADAADSKQSSVFRFGKAIVSAFNPIGVWGNVSEIWKGHDSSSKESGSREMLADMPHAARIEKAYEEYKASAAYRSVTPSTAPLYRYGYSGDDTTSPTKFLPVQTPQPQSHQPSAPDIIQSSISKELPPTPLEWQALPASTSKRSSFQTIKNSRSFLNLSQSLRKEQSHKDLARENKLRKKVSNLEEKLLKYKRELSAFAHDENKVDELEGDAHIAPAGPSAPSVPPAHDTRYMRMRARKFVPGALPSLPSERLLFESEEPSAIRELSGQESSPKKPLYTRRSEPRLRRTAPRIGEEVLTKTPATTITNRTIEGGSTPPSRKRKSPSPDPASIRRRRISTTYSRDIRNNGASLPPSPPPSSRHSTELTGPRPRPGNARAEAENRRNQPPRKAKEIRPEYYPNYDLITRPVPVPERSESRPKHAQTLVQAPAKAPIPISTPTPTPSHSDSNVSVEVAFSIPVPPPIPSSTKPPPTSKQKPKQRQIADADANAAPIPPPRSASVPITTDIISRTDSPKKHNTPPRRRANDKPITVTPGQRGDENIPPVPPLPVEHGGSPAKEPWEWPEDCF
ncbi:hypothetical protein MferCBS31731_005482 [Microsporum ferrugineum]